MASYTTAIYSQQNDCQRENLHNKGCSIPDPSAMFSHSKKTGARELQRLTGNNLHMKGARGDRARIESTYNATGKRLPVMHASYRAVGVLTGR